MPVPFPNTEVIAGSRVVVLDCETTGLHASSRVVELGLVFLDGGGETTGEWSSLFRGDKWIDDDITAVNGITTAMLQNAPRFREVSESLARMFGTLRVVAHNAPFDHARVSHEFTRIRREPPPPFVCSMALLGNLGYGRLSLEAARNLFGVSVKPDHSALTDALVTAEILRELSQRHPEEFALW
ncbi:MAG: exonuclease domain-containing protein [Acidimicrobiales bacterium]